MFDVPIPTAPTYATAALVARTRREQPYSKTESGPEMGRRPTLDEVNQSILYWEDWIDRECKQAWRQRRVTNYVDDMKIGALKFGNRWDSAQRLFDNWWVIPMPYPALRPFVSGTNKIEIWNGAQYQDLVAAGPDDRNAGNYFTEPDMGFVCIRRGLMMFRDWRVRLTFDYGDTAVPGPISIATAYLVAADMEITQPGRTPEAQADKVNSQSRYTLWTRKANEIMERFKNPRVV